MTKTQELINSLNCEDYVRYKDFTFLDESIPFKELFANKNIEYVQVHSLKVIETDAYRGIIGFCGTFKWEDGFITSLDGDSYSKDMMVYGYNYFEYEEASDGIGLDILVGDDW